MHFLKECEVQFGTYKLLERDREKIEEGIELTKRVFKLKANNYTLEEIAKECNISVSKVKEILE